MELYGEEEGTGEQPAEGQGQQQYLFSPLIYSEPALNQATSSSPGYNPPLAGFMAFSELALPQV
jgi:hypothetical protein